MNSKGHFILSMLSFNFTYNLLKIPFNLICNVEAICIRVGPISRQD